MFSEKFSAEFIVNVDRLGLSNAPFCRGYLTASLFMYPDNPERYDVPAVFVKHDGAIDMHGVRRSLENKLPSGPHAVILKTRGFDENIVRFMYEVMEEDGIDVLAKEINKVQISFGCHKEIKQNKSITQYVFPKSDKVLMQCMLALIENFDPENFKSKEIQEIKKWSITNM